MNCQRWRQPNNRWIQSLGSVQSLTWLSLPVRPVSDRFEGVQSARLGWAPQCLPPTWRPQWGEDREGLGGLPAHAPLPLDHRQALTPSGKGSSTWFKPPQASLLLVDDYYLPAMVSIALHWGSNGRALLAAMGITTVKHADAEHRPCPPVCSVPSLPSSILRQPLTTRAKPLFGKGHWSLPGYQELLCQALSSFQAPCDVNSSYTQLLHTGVAMCAGFPYKSEKFLPEQWIYHKN